MSFGMLGVITSMTWQIVPSFALFKTIYEHLSWEMFCENYDQIMHASHFISLFIDWQVSEFSSVWMAHDMK